MWLYYVYIKSWYSLLNVCVNDFSFPDCGKETANTVCTLWKPILQFLKSLWEVNAVIDVKSIKSSANERNCHAKNGKQHCLDVRVNFGEPAQNFKWPRVQGCEQTQNSGCGLGEAVSEDLLA